MSKYPITQAQYEVIMGDNPSRFEGENHPVERVTWSNARKFCRKLSQITGKTYQLPTEAQWEYACRAGNQGKWCFGDPDNQLQYYAWYKDNSEKQTHPVGEKKPNSWGLYDMHGNVWEWCEDDYVDNYLNTPTDGTAYKADKVHFKVLRGGSWCNKSYRCRSGNRNGFFPLIVNYNIGFRVVQIID